MKKFLIFIGLLFTLGLPAFPLTEWLNEFDSNFSLIRYELVWWLSVLLVLAYINYIEKRPLSSIGFTRITLKDTLFSILSAVVIIIGFVFLYNYLFPKIGITEQQSVNKLLLTPVWWRIISTVRAAVSEEIFFRGYGIERLDELIGNRKYAAFISWGIFTAEHVTYWGWSHILIAGFGGAILTIQYLWKRKLWANIFTHFLVDLASVFS